MKKKRLKKETISMVKALASNITSASKNEKEMNFKKTKKNRNDNNKHVFDLANSLNIE